MEEGRSGRGEAEERQRGRPGADRDAEAPMLQLKSHIYMRFQFFFTFFTQACVNVDFKIFEPSLSGFSLILSPPVFAGFSCGESRLRGFGERSCVSF